MGATAQFLAVSAARKAVADLTKGADKEADLSNLRLAAPIDVGVRSRLILYETENPDKTRFSEEDQASAFLEEN